MGFKIGDKLVYPNQGVGVIDAIQDADSDGTVRSCYQVRLLANNSRVTVPIGNSDRLGLRPLVPTKEVGRVFSHLETRALEAPTGDWKGRYQKNLEKMRTGKLTQVADVLKDLSLVQKQKVLSYREKKMYERARFLVISEVAEVSGIALADVEKNVDKSLTSALGTEKKLKGDRFGSSLTEPVERTAARSGSGRTPPRALALENRDQEKKKLSGSAVTARHVAPGIPSFSGQRGSASDALRRRRDH